MIEPESYPMIAREAYFETPNGERHVVKSFHGYVVDENGRSHRICDCVVFRWTREEIDLAKKRAEELAAALREPPKDP